MHSVIAPIYFDFDGNMLNLDVDLQHYVTEVVGLDDLSKYFTRYNLIADGEIWYESDYSGMKIAHLKTKKREK